MSAGVRNSSKFNNKERNISDLERSLSPKVVLNSLFSKEFLGNVKNELV